MGASEVALGADLGHIENFEGFFEKDWMHYTPLDEAKPAAHDAMFHPRSIICPTLHDGRSIRVFGLGQGRGGSS
ncbi:hypothetical protein M406DRAFT_323377, partial [Cryphonectria parasitica EP155]